MDNIKYSFQEILNKYMTDELKKGDIIQNCKTKQTFVLGSNIAPTIDDIINCLFIVVDKEIINEDMVKISAGLSKYLERVDVFRKYAKDTLEKDIDDPLLHIDIDDLLIALATDKYASFIANGVITIEGILDYVEEKGLDINWNGGLKKTIDNYIEQCY